MLLSHLAVLFTAFQISLEENISAKAQSRSLLAKLFQSMGHMDDEINNRPIRNARWPSEGSDRTETDDDSSQKRVSKSLKLLHRNPLNLNKAYANLCHRINIACKSVKGTTPLKITPSIVTKHKLYCKTGYFLAVSVEGQVKGIRKGLNNVAELEFLSVGRQLVLIRHAPTKMYITMGKRSEVHATRTPTFESVFLYESYKMTSFITFKSLYYRHKNWYLALKRKTGQVKLGSTTAARRSAAHFLLI